LHASGAERRPRRARIGEVKNVAKPAAFFVSEWSQYITGTVVVGRLRLAGRWRPGRGYQRMSFCVRQPTGVVERSMILDADPRHRGDVESFTSPCDFRAA
jgi:hypothetical protein